MSGGGVPAAADVGFAGPLATGVAANGTGTALWEDGHMAKSDETGGGVPRPRDGRHPHVHVPHEQELFTLGRGGQERFADAVTAFVGSMPFVYLHLLWFTSWIVVNEGLFGDEYVFDSFPYGLLTMIVSLEAIFLSTFVLISQNRDARRQNVRADLDFETNIRSEVWSMHIGRKLGLDPVAIERRVQEVLRQARDGGPAAGVPPAAGPPPGRR
jgi:uncharacterized membrane protein